MSISERTPLSYSTTAHRYDQPTPRFPAYNSSRRKPRRWPLVLRFIKGSIHVDIAVPVLAHMAWTALCVYLDQHVAQVHLSLPDSTIPSLSIVVGLMLVFRNSTSYDRFWQGSQYITAMGTHIRNLARAFLIHSYDVADPASPSPRERADTERNVRLLLALLYATKNHLRAEYGRVAAPLPSSFFARVVAEVAHAVVPDGSNGTTNSSTEPSDDDEAAAAAAAAARSAAMNRAEYASLLPPGTQDHEEAGLSLMLQLALPIEAYIRRGEARRWWAAPQAARLSGQLDAAVAAYASMETIHLTPLPVAILIHMRQVLALFCAVLPLAVVGDQRWWAVPMVGFIAFTLYGIDAIGAQLEDPFGYDRNDIKVDALVEDMRVEMSVLLAEWRRGGDMFPKRYVVEKAQNA